MWISRKALAVPPNGSQGSLVIMEKRGKTSTDQPTDSGVISGTGDSRLIAFIGDVHRQIDPAVTRLEKLDTEVGRRIDLVFPITWP